MWAPTVSSIRPTTSCTRSSSPEPAERRRPAFVFIPPLRASPLFTTRHTLVLLSIRTHFYENKKVAQQTCALRLAWQLIWCACHVKVLVFFSSWDYASVIAAASQTLIPYRVFYIMLGFATWRRERLPSGLARSRRTNLHFTQWRGLSEKERSSLSTETSMWDKRNVRVQTGHYTQVCHRKSAIVWLARLCLIAKEINWLSLTSEWTNEWLEKKNIGQCVYTVSKVNSVGELTSILQIACIVLPSTNHVWNIKHKVSSFALPTNRRSSCLEDSYRLSAKGVMVSWRRAAFLLKMYRWFSPEGLDRGQTQRTAPYQLSSSVALVSCQLWLRSSRAVWVGVVRCKCWLAADLMAGRAPPCRTTRKRRASRALSSHAT